MNLSPIDAQRRQWLLAGAGALLAGCGGGSGNSSAPPEVLAFSADRDSYKVGEQAQLQVRFRGATARIEPGIGEVFNGQTVATPVLDSSRTLRLTVQTPGLGSTTRDLPLDVSFRDQWLALPDFAITSHATVNAGDGSVIVIGGSRAQAVLSNAIDRFDPATRRFQRLGQMAAGRSNHTALRLGNGQILVCGGLTSENVAPFAELVDETTGAVAHAGELVQPRNWHAATALADGRVLMVGGYGRDTVELWDPATRGWRQPAARMAHDREHPTATLLSDGRVLIAGGRSETAHYRFAELFDPRTETFTPAEGAITLRRQLHRAHRQPDGRVLILGGEDFRNGIEPLSEVLRFNPQFDDFTGLAPLATPRTLAASLLLPEGDVLLFGGQTPEAPASASAAAWRADRQRTLAALPAARQWHTVNRLPDGRVLLLGGDDGQGQYATQTLIYE